VFANAPSGTSGGTPSNDDELLQHDFCIPVAHWTDWRVELSGFAPGEYVLYAYAPADRETGSFMAGGFTLPSLPGHPSSTLIEGTSWARVHVTIFDGTLVIRFVPGPSNGYGLAGIQLVPYELEPYCKPGVSASGCTANLDARGFASATAPSGFVLEAVDVEGAKDGLFFFGANGRQANPWGTSSSYQCVVPPVKRGGLLQSVGTSGQCDGAFAQDLNAHWTAKPAHNPGAGAVVQAQLWYRDPWNTSNQTTSLSDAIEFAVGP
jgi:hypothetical protein